MAISQEKGGPRKGPYSIVFLDIDGTLVDSRFQISENTKKLLGRLEKRGVPVVLCSARNPAGIELVERQAGLHSPIVCYVGSLVLDTKRSILSDSGIPVEAAVRFKRYAAEQFPGLFVSSYIYDVWLVDSAEDPLVRRDAEILHQQPLEGDLEAAAQSMPHVHKLLCVGPPGQIMTLQKQAAPLFPELQFLRSGSEYLEVLRTGVSKRTAMETLLAYYQLDREASVACGDHFVDLEMLQYAGLGIAMGNAPEQVKEAADRVTACNDCEGVYIALKNLKFSPPEPRP